jgi:hypothetical protein
MSIHEWYLEATVQIRREMRRLGAIKCTDNGIPCLKITMGDQSFVLTPFSARWTDGHGNWAESAWPSVMLVAWSRFREQGRIARREARRDRQVVRDTLDSLKEKNTP